MSHSGLMTDAGAPRDPRRRLQWAFVRWAVAAPAAVSAMVAVLSALLGIEQGPAAGAITIALLISAGAVVAKLLHPPNLRLAVAYVTIWSSIATVVWLVTSRILVI